MHLYILKAVKYIIAHTFNITHWLTSTLLQQLQRGDAYRSPCLLAWLIHSDSFHRNPHRKHIMYFFFFFFLFPLFCFSADIFVHTEVPDKSLLGIWMLSCYFHTFSVWDWQQCLLTAVILELPCSCRSLQEWLEYFHRITFIIFFYSCDRCEVFKHMWPSRS